MLTADYDVVVLLFTRNCREALPRTIESVLGQTFDKNRIRLVAVDNNSTDGTYESLLAYAQNTSISVYRLSETQLPTRLLRKTTATLDFAEWKYITIVNPGDTIYPNFIEKCSELMDRFTDSGNRFLICETDLLKNGVVMKQNPIFSSSCILMKREHYPHFFLHGMGHKVQCFFSRKAIPESLPELPFCVDYTDFFKKAVYSFTAECIYVRDALACTSPAPCEDMLKDLILRLFLVKRSEHSIAALFAGKSFKYLDLEGTRSQVHENLARLALQYASQALEDGQVKAAEDILIFAEMVHDDITRTDLFSALKAAVAGNTLHIPERRMAAAENTVAPPDGAQMI